MSLKIVNGPHAYSHAKYMDTSFSKALCLDLLQKGQSALQSTEIMPNSKPKGVLWIGLNGDWRKFIATGISGNRRHPSYTYKVTLTGDTKMLLIDSGEAAQAFFAEFGRDKIVIEWERVRPLCDGIMVNLPYWSVDKLWDYPGTDWLYGYDCACIALWNVRDGTCFEHVVYEKQVKKDLNRNRNALQKQVKKKLREEHLAKQQLAVQNRSLPVS